MVRLNPRLLVMMACAVAAGAVVGCGSFHLGGNDDSNVLGSVQYSYTYAFQGFTRTVAVSPDGLMHVAQLEGAGGTVKSVEVQLTGGQQAMITSKFKGWKELKPYYAVLFGPTIWIEYNGHRVETSGGSDTPQKFKDAQQVLDILAQAALNYRYPESAPAPDPAQGPPTKPAPTMPAAAP